MMTHSDDMLRSRMYGTVRFRASRAELLDLHRRATEKNLALADLVRAALGLEVRPPRVRADETP